MLKGRGETKEQLYTSKSFNVPNVDHSQSIDYLLQHTVVFPLKREPFYRSVPFSTSSHLQEDIAQGGIPVNSRILDRERESTYVPAGILNPWNKQDRYQRSSSWYQTMTCVSTTVFLETFIMRIFDHLCTSWTVAIVYGISLRSAIEGRRDEPTTRRISARILSFEYSCFCSVRYRCHSLTSRVAEVPVYLDSQPLEALPISTS